MKSDAEPLESTFELNDTLYAKANIHKTEEVYLWLGVCPLSPLGLHKEPRPFSQHRANTHDQANVMLAYPLAEAESLLDGKLEAAKGSLANCEEDLDFLREQITTMEVATARVYNWDVGMRRKEKPDDKADDEGDAKAALKS